MTPSRATVSVVALLAVGLAVGSLTAPGRRQQTTRSAAESVEVVGSTAVCPDLRQGNTLATRVSVGSDPLPDGRTFTGGTVGATRLSGGAKAEAVGVNAPGEVSVGLGTSIDKDGLVVAATGSLAAGLEVEQVTRGEEGLDRGLANLRCDAPRTDLWFVGGATLVGDTSLLVLANVDDTPTTLDISVFSDASKTQPLDPHPTLGQGITVAPHSRQILNLDTLAPDRNNLALHIACRRGRIAAGVRHARMDGKTPLGVDWVPRSTAPAEKVVVPALPQGPGTRALLVTNPGADDVSVSIQITTNDGQFVPAGLAEITIPASSTGAVRIDPLVATSPLTAAITSTGGPIVAGAFIQDRQTGPVRELAYTASSAPLSGPALMTDLVINRPTESTLILSALDTEATVIVSPIRVLGTKGALPAPKTVVVPAGRTVSLKLSTFYPPATETQLALEVRPLPGSGPVYAARYLRERGAHGPLSTMLDLQGPAQLVSRPAVLENPELGW